MVNINKEIIETGCEKGKERFEKLFVYAFDKSDGENGVHEDLLINATVEEAIKHGKNLWVDADKYMVSDIQLGDPYSFLFADNKFESMKKRVIPAFAPSREEFDKIQRRIDELNK